MIRNDDIADCANCLCLAARRGARALTRAFDRRMRPQGIRTTQFSILTNLILRGPLTIGALADALGMERTTLTRNLALIERHGWIEIRAGDDARSRIAALTAAGRRKVDAALPAWREAQASASAAIGAAGTAALQHLATRPLH